MEVLVARSRRRVSRALISLLAVCLVVGGITALRRPGGNKSAESGPPLASLSDPNPNNIQIVPALEMSAAMARSSAPATMPATDSSPANLVAAPMGPVGWSRLAQVLSAAKSGTQLSKSTTQPTAVAASNSSASSWSAWSAAAASTPADHATNSSSASASATQPAIARNSSKDIASSHIREVALTSAAPPAADATAAASSDPMTRAKALADGGDLIDARALLNDQLIGGTLSDAQATAVKQQISLWNQSLVFSPRTYTGDPFSSSVAVKSGDNMSKIASEHDVTWELLSRINNVTPQKMRAGSSLKVLVGPFHAVVSKKAFTIDLYLGGPGGKGSMYVMTYPVGLGKDDSTPPGTWMVELHKKIKNPTYYSPRGEGVIEAGDPKNPLGPFWIGLSGIDGQAVGQQSYGIHGTIDPDSIGKQSSMGCIRLHNEDVAVVYEMMVEGKSLVIVTP